MQFYWGGGGGGGRESPCQFNQELQPTSLNSSIFIFYDPFSELIFLAWISIKHCNFERILDGSHEHKKL